MAIGYATEARMRLIDFLLHHFGSVGRAEIMDYFGISPAQATRDFAMYLRLAPGNAVLNGVSKRWCRSDIFIRLYP